MRIIVKPTTQLSLTRGQPGDRPHLLELTHVEQKTIGQWRPHLHWCVNGDFVFLPLHASGIYAGPETGCPDYGLVLHPDDFRAQLLSPILARSCEGTENTYTLTDKSIVATLAHTPQICPEDLSSKCGGFNGNVRVCAGDEHADERVASIRVMLSETWTRIEAFC
jgi:hypothetical protein